MLSLRGVAEEVGDVTAKSRQDVLAHKFVVFRQDGSLRGRVIDDDGSVLGRDEPHLAHTCREVLVNLADNFFEEVVWRYDFDREIGENLPRTLRFAFRPDSRSGYERDIGQSLIIANLKGRIRAV